MIYDYDLNFGTALHAQFDEYNIFCDIAFCALSAILH